MPATIEWKYRDRPRVVGMYLYRLVGQWPIRIGKVRLGEWREAQDPSLWYLVGYGSMIKDGVPACPLDAIEADFYGPIPEPTA